jgi:hypothetical protein
MLAPVKTAKAQPMLTNRNPVLLPSVFLSTWFATTPVPRRMSTAVPSISQTKIEPALIVDLHSFAAKEDAQT